MVRSKRSNQASPEEWTGKTSPKSQDPSHLAAAKQKNTRSCCGPPHAQKTHMRPRTFPPETVYLDNCVKLRVCGTVQASGVAWFLLLPRITGCSSCARRPARCKWASGPLPPSDCTAKNTPAAAVTRLAKTDGKNVHLASLLARLFVLFLFFDVCVCSLSTKSSAIPTPAAKHLVQLCLAARATCLHSSCCFDEHHFCQVLLASTSGFMFFVRMSATFFSPATFCNYNS